MVLLSGGIDSTTLLHYLKRGMGVEALYALSFRYGQKHERELEMAGRQADIAGVREHRVVDLGCLGEMIGGASALTGPGASVPSLCDVAAAQRAQPPTYVPNRNMVMLSLAAAWAESRGITVVFYGAQAQDEYGYWDCTSRFVARLNTVLALNRDRAVEVRAPFVGKRKAEVVKIGLELGVDYGRTWTCYRGGAAACGECPSCVERAAAFRELGRCDPAGPDG